MGGIWKDACIIITGSFAWSLSQNLINVPPARMLQKQNKTKKSQAAPKLSTMQAPLDAR